MTWHLDDEELWSLTCDICRDACHTKDVDVRFESGPALMAFAKHNGWEFTDDGEICSACSLVKHCGRVGHLWGPWRELEPSTYLADQTKRRMRICELCTWPEVDPPFPPKKKP